MKNPFYLTVGAALNQPSKIGTNQLVAQYLESHPGIVRFHVRETFPSDSWELTRLPENLPTRLTTLVLDGCPRLSHLPKYLPAGLTTLGLLGCSELIDLPENLPAGLTTLDINDCAGLTSLPENLPAGLTTLDVFECNALADLPQFLPARVITLRVSRCSSLKRLPANLPAGLTTLAINNCDCLTHLPANLPAGLTTLDLKECSNLTRLPENLPSGLTELNLSGCSSLSGLPENLPSGLMTLKLSGCSNLSRLPETLPAGLTTLYLGSNLTQLPDNLPAGLTTLYLSAYLIPLPEDLANHLPAGLTALNLGSNLTQLPENLPAKLTKLNLSGCSNLTHLPENLPAGLTDLDLSWCSNLTSLSKKLPAGLTRLDLFLCRKLTYLPENLPARLTTLKLSGCFNLTQLPNNLPAGLMTLYLRDCCNLTHLPQNLPHGLTTLDLSFCESLNRLPENLPAGLTTLNITGSKLTHLPENLPAGLKSLELNECLRLSGTDTARHISSRPKLPAFSLGIESEQLQIYRAPDLVEISDNHPNPPVAKGLTGSPSAMGASAMGQSDVSPSQPAEDLVGTIYVGKYELNSIIGTGGMGVIYRGRQVFLDWPVAVKMLKSSSMPAKARTRFHQEAKAVSALKHPGIVSVLDFGVDELDRPYMVMEYVEGCTLSDLLIERVTLPFEDLLPVSLEVCDALSAAHKKGIVHRDLKPSNIILVVNEDGEVQIKLLDFGIAKMLDVPEYTMQDLTKTGDVLGTPLYMSPEQIGSKNVTYRSDLYSLGCTLYTCLTGIPPFVGETKMATMDMHCAEKPLSLKEASEGLDFPPGIEAIIMRLLEKRPEDRYDSAEQVKDALIATAVKNGLMEQPSKQPNSSTQPYRDGASTRISKAISDVVQESQVVQSHSGSHKESEKIDRARHEATRNPREPGAHLKNTIYWVADLPDRVKAARAAKFKSLPRRADPYGEQEHSLLSTRVEASMNKTFSIIGAVVFVLILIVVAGAAFYCGWIPHIRK